MKTVKMETLLSLAVCFCLCFSLLPVQVSAGQPDYSVLPAFPGAEGFGYAASGGRGGEVYHVTSYELTGQGTFHDALTTAGDTPRTIIFEISGEITIPQIIVRNKSDITIAGQTAPGEGVTIKGNNIRFINCENIIIRYLRFRMGSQDFNDDSMYFEDCRNVIIDHSTFSWGTDEVLSILSKDYDNPKSKNITVQWSIISEGLLTHSMGGLIEMNTITMHHNLYAHNNDRNPKTKGQIDFVNNVVYNWGDFPYVAGGESGTKGYGNVVGNYFIAGKNSANPQYAIVRGNENYSVYLSNNRIDSNKNGILDGTDTGIGIIETARPSVVVPDRFDYPPVHIQEPETAYEYILDYAGASLVRDAVDQRIVSNVRNQTGVIIGHENDAGGFAELKQEAGPVDTDRDGMPDEWERAKRLNPYDPEDRNDDKNGNGYTNLEDYLNELAAPGFPADYPMELLEWSGPPFTPPEPEPEPEQPEPTPEPSMDGQVVRNVIVNDNGSNGARNAANWSVQENLQLGDLVAGDRGYRFVSVPDELVGMEWIRSAVESRGASNDDLLSFFLAADTDVYVAHDSRITAKPEWLASAYEDTGRVITDDQPVMYNVYKKRYDAGSFVVMGSNNNSSRMNYFVILCPASPETEPPGGNPSGLTGKMTEHGSVLLTCSEIDDADTYFIYRSSSVDPYFRVLASMSTPEYEDTDVEYGVIYRYKVSALNAGGESELSQPVEVSVFDAAEPAPPAPAGLSVAYTGSIKVGLEWMPMDEATCYNVFRADEPEGSYRKIGSSRTAEYVDETVHPSSTYSYKVSSLGIGGESELSKSAGVTTNPPVSLPHAPQGLTAGEVTTSAFEFEWTPADDAESYRVYRKADSEQSLTLIASTTETFYRDNSISVGQSGYSYKVSSVNEMGESTPSDELSIAMPVPAAPSDLFVGLVGDTFVGLIWTSHGGSNQVNIYRETNGKAVNVGTAKVNTFYDRTAEPDVEYTYYIKAENASGESERSNTVTVIPGLVTVLENDIEQFAASGDLSGPIVSQLANTLRQARHHASRGNTSQIIHFMEKFLKQLDSPPPPSHVSSDAMTQLSRNAQLHLRQLKEQVTIGQP